MIWWTQLLISLSLRLLYPLSCDMISKQIHKTFNMSKRLESLYMTFYSISVTILKFHWPAVNSWYKHCVRCTNFLVFKFCGKTQFPHNFGQIARNYVDNRKLIKWNYDILRSEKTTLLWQRNRNAKDLKINFNKEDPN